MEKTVMKRIIIFSLLLAVALSFPAYALTPMETVQLYIGRVIDVLQDTTLKGDAGKEIKIEKIQAIATELFDFIELSKRTLGQNWNRLTSAQQTEFVSLYQKMLKKNYAHKIVSYHNERILYGKETPLSEKTFEIETLIKAQPADIPIHYRLIQKDEKWVVYDVIIEGVSLVNNYRSQFREILANKPPEALIDLLKKK